MMDESEACSLPGGLASVKRQFEKKQEFSSTSSQSSVTQFHFEQRSVQVRVQSWISPPTHRTPAPPPSQKKTSRHRVMCTSVSDNSRIRKLLSFSFLFLIFFSSFTSLSLPALAKVWLLSGTFKVTFEIYGTLTVI